MAKDERRAALEGHIAALETQVDAIQGDKEKGARSYVIKTQVFEDCIGGPEPPEPPTEPGGGESMNARLDRIEAQLQRIVAKLEA